MMGGTWMTAGLHHAPCSLGPQAPARRLLLPSNLNTNRAAPSFVTRDSVNYWMKASLPRRSEPLAATMCQVRGRDQWSYRSNKGCLLTRRQGMVAVTHHRYIGRRSLNPWCQSFALETPPGCYDETPRRQYV
jgi:hypothetical protein